MDADPREKVLRLRADSPISGDCPHTPMHIMPRECRLCILAALRQTAEEERAVADAALQDAIAGWLDECEKARAAETQRWIEACGQGAAVGARSDVYGRWVGGLWLDAFAEGERAGFDRAANAIRALWPHIEIPRGDVKVGGERWHAPTVDPGAPTCLRCKIEEALNAAR